MSPLRPQTSSPRKMTLALIRGNPWSRLRTCAPSIFGKRVTAGGRGAAAGPTSWNMAAALGGFGQVTFFEAADKAEPLFVTAVEGSSAQKVSAEIQIRSTHAGAQFAPDHPISAKHVVSPLHYRLRVQIGASPL